MVSMVIDNVLFSTTVMEKIRPGTVMDIHEPAREYSQNLT